MRRLSRETNPGTESEESGARGPTAACAALFFFAAAAISRAVELPAPVTLDLPLTPDVVTPAWLGHPSTPPSVFGALDLTIAPPDANASLLITVYFQETPGGFLRVIWKGTQGAAVVADNLYENIGMANQRSLLIPAATLGGEGSLVLQSGSGTLGVARIKLEWLEDRDGLVSQQVTDLLVTPSTGQTVPGKSVDGTAPLPQPGAWQKDIVTVPVSDPAVRIEQGIDFSVQLDDVPAQARLGLKETGLPLGQRLVVWVNEKRAGTITPAVPGLLDDGFFGGGTAPDGSNGAAYVGWRDGSFSIPVSLLRSGVNTLQFSAEADADGATPAAPASPSTPLALKAIVLQLGYPATTGPTAATPTGPTTGFAAPAPSSPVAESAQGDSEETSSVPEPGAIAAAAAGTPLPAASEDPSPEPHLSVAAAPHPLDDSTAANASP